MKQFNISIDDGLDLSIKYSKEFSKAYFNEWAYQINNTETIGELFYAMLSPVLGLSSYCGDDSLIEYLHLDNDEDERSIIEFKYEFLKAIENAKSRL